MKYLLVGEGSVPLHPKVHTKLILNKLALMYRIQRQASRQINPMLLLNSHLTVEIAYGKDHRIVFISKLLFKPFAFTTLMGGHPIKGILQESK